MFRIPAGASNRAFTLLELMIVIVILAVLMTISIIQYLAGKENVLLQEAQANLKLIASGEKIYRLETDTYVDIADADEARRVLKLSLPQATTDNWNYRVVADTNNFTASAERVTNSQRRWCINETQEEPYNCQP